ncbi:DEAD/DEAH box helicase family protein [Mucilaginibacter pocheonensis]|uniref:Type III restriction enzyme n=1 Tax=Mucilaginibacter pocheonensis TaxID=398050 RepID=A0ABU1T988_9SPHI|nr:DEAD/DEAH box helicase family protein [Mucilaginibacter pocheonensis]MDR6941385.1 type III restriction enzyme [Mucilaginibacter pocheonensis]
MQTLDETLSAALKFNGPDFFRNRVPALINQNLRSGFSQRAYQQEAFGRFVFYWNDYHDRPKGVPSQLLFHMATGSGKTLIMAGLILYLYEKGYRNFLFFVNSTTIIDKTRDNFFNTASGKYLFAEEIEIAGKQIRIREVDNFQGVNHKDINIVFSTIQGLHSSLNVPRENSLTYDDFEDKKIVLISDEAHHINAETKKGSELSADELMDVVSWERTVNRIFNANVQNILLEFTATIDLDIPEIQKKYSEKLIYDYPLRQFRLDGYSKEVKVLQADLPPFERALQGVLLSQYRRKIFEKHHILIKPVILFKSRTIKESQAFWEDFKNGMQGLQPERFEKIKNATNDPVIQAIFHYLDKERISFENLIIELKEDFSTDKLISVNSKDESGEKQLAINSLEDERNEYRAVFAVDKLNEGWDVLNLFDIVRLYDTRDAKAGKPGKTTMAEAQLIGRGARYCPFQLYPDQPPYIRKFDEDLKNEMRICEELYYHCSYNPKYISELYTALVEIGIKSKETKERTIRLKEQFKQTSFYKTGFIFLNELKKNDQEDVFGLQPKVISQHYQIALKTGYLQSITVFNSGQVAGYSTSAQDYKLIDFGAHVIRKAISKLEFYEFNHLQTLLPNLSSITEFIHSEAYLGNIKIEVSGLPEQLEHLSQQAKLEACLKVLEEIAKSLTTGKIEFQGTREFKPYMLKDKIKDKTLSFGDSGPDQEFGRSMINPQDTSYYLDLSQKDWYAFDDCFGTSEEKLFIKYIDKVYAKLKTDYDEVFLIRNERHFKIYNFEDGRALEPDFVLFLVNNKKENYDHYQVFVEPKGSHLLQQDEWKEKFLLSLQKENLVEQLWRDKKYIIWGMPFYNEVLRKEQFEGSLQQLLNND